MAEDLLARLPHADVIPLPTVAEIVGWTRTAQHHAVNSGVVNPTGPPPSGRRGYLVTYDEAVRIVVCAALAFAAGMAVVTMLRAFEGTGLDPVALVKNN